MQLKNPTDCLLVWSIYLICHLELEKERKDNRETDFGVSGAWIMKHSVLFVDNHNTVYVCLVPFKYAFFSDLDINAQ